MKIVDVKGLVLSETNYSDSSKILNVLTEEYGILGILSKGCRNIKSKLRSSSRKLIYGTFHFYYKENGLSVLISTDIINGYFKTMMDLEKIVYSSYILDLTKQIVKQSDISTKGILALVTQVLDKIELGLDPSIMANILELKFLNYLGVSPILDSCVNCGRTSNIVSVSASSGGLLCSSCSNCVDSVHNLKLIKLLRLFYYVDVEKITKIDVNETTKKELNHFLDEYYDRYTGIYLKGKYAMKNIAKFVEK